MVGISGRLCFQEPVSRSTTATPEARARRRLIQLAAADDETIVTGPGYRPRDGGIAAGPWLHAASPDAILLAPDMWFAEGRQSGLGRKPGAHL